VQNDTNKK